MAKYIDSSRGDKAQFIRHWLDKNLIADSKSFHIQSGYFTYEAIEPFSSILQKIQENGGTINFVLGSNAGSLSARDATNVFKIISKGTNTSLTVVAFQNAEFHPKAYHIERPDGSVSALVGSGNLTQYGLALNIESAFILDTIEGDDPSVINEVKEEIAKWSTLGESEGAYRITKLQDIDDLRQSKIIDLGNVEVRTSGSKNAPAVKRAKHKLKKALKSYWKFIRGPRSGGRRAPSPKVIKEFWIQTGALTGGSGNQIDLSMGGVHGSKGSVNLFGVDPSNVNNIKYLNFKYKGVIYQGNPIKFPLTSTGNTNGTWRAQMNGVSPQGDKLTPICRDNFRHKILVFTEYAKDSYEIKDLDESNLNLIMAKSKYWDQNKPASTGKYFGQVS